MRPPSVPDRLTTERLLLVEGSNDVHFFSALLRYHSRNRIDIESVGGKDGFVDALSQLRRRRGFRQLRWLGVVRDADFLSDQAGASATFRGLATELGRAGLPVPTRSWSRSTSDPALTVVAFVLPPGAEEGDLEGWVLQTHLRDTNRRCAEQLLACLGSEAPVKRSKAMLAAYFASIDPEKLSIGDAIQNVGTISLTSDVFRPFIDLIPADDETF